MQKEIKQLLKRAEKVGCVVSHGRNHIKILTPGGNAVPCPSTPKRPENTVRYVVQQLAKNGDGVARK